MRMYDHTRQAIWSIACTTANPVIYVVERVETFTHVVITDGRTGRGRAGSAVLPADMAQTVDSKDTAGPVSTRPTGEGRDVAGTAQRSGDRDRTQPARQVVSAEVGTGIQAADNYKWWVLVAAIFGVFVSILDATVVNTALPKIQTAFGTDLHLASYVATGYTLAQGVCIAASGYLANRYGVKRVYLISLALFTLGSALCGIAWSMPVLITFRVLQGAGGATLLPLSITLVFGAFPPEQRGLANGVFGIPVLAAPAFGPALGGYIAQYVDWRWIFYINLPIGIIGIILGWRVLRESPLQDHLRFDWRGFLILAPGLGLLLYGLSNLSYDGWSSILTVSGPTLVALLLLALAIPVELRTNEPLLDLRLFRGRNFLVGNIIIWIATVGLFGATFLLPQYLQVLRGLTPFASGLLLMPQGLAAIVGTTISGTLYNRVGPRALIISGAVAITIDTFLLSTLSTLNSNLTLFIPLLIIRGLALPFLSQTTNTLALNEISNRALAGANTLLNITRSVISSLAVAILINILLVQQQAHLAALSSGGVAGHVVRQQAQALAYQDIYMLTAIVTIPLLLLPLLLRTKPTRPAAQPAASTATRPAAGTA